MGVTRMPRQVSRTQHAEEAAERLRRLADEIERDGDVRGMMVIVDRGTPAGDCFSVEHTGILKQSRERACWAVSRVLHHMLSSA